MNLYSTDFHNISDADNKQWQVLKAEEIVSLNGKPSMIRKSLYHKYPKSVRHFLSLFPNNFMDAIDLSESKETLKDILKKFETLLETTSTTEQGILNFIRQNNAWFIIGSLLKKNYTFGHHSLYLFPELQFPPSYRVDFLLIGENSHGHHFVFVELENPYGDVTLKDGSYGQTIRKGISQIDDWETWVKKNYSTLKLSFERAQNKKTTLPNEFRDFDKTRVHYCVVAGRRSDYNEKTYRLRRSNLEQRKLFVIHYDNLIDYASETIGTPSY